MCARICMYICEFICVCARVWRVVSGRAIDYPCARPPDSSGPSHEIAKASNAFGERVCASRSDASPPGARCAM
uniref:Putative secreted protein n=1 Tax=Anopheles darlingi TaxID=43151 RepID=A0A2M4DLR4_ANODA